MLLNWFQRLALRGRLSQGQPRARWRRGCGRLRLESLEDRLAPALITVTGMTDGAGVFNSSLGTDTTLRGAIANAQSGDTIGFAAALAGQTIDLNLNDTNQAFG